MSDEKEGGFKVVDRRRIDSEGNDRGAEERETKPASKPVSKTPPTESPKQNADMGAIGFSEFVMSFATQALMQLGQMDPPPGVSIPKDVRAAKQTIDILQMLETKTKGNLDQREAALIEDILHNLRIAFVNVTQGKK